MERLRPGDPERIGRYECIGRLGSGGTGDVFLARADDGRLVALKLIHPDLAADPSFRARFPREAAAIRRIDGSYTAPLLDAGDVPRPWLATAYLPGVSLDEAVARHGPLSAEATRRLGAALAEALDEIHGAGVVHCDLKPTNILLTADGPRVVDFGIAGGLEGGGGDGTAAQADGTLAYMAPEQMTGGPVTTAADVFALGGVLVFCRTGVPPFGAAPLPELLDRIARDRPATGDWRLRELIAACLSDDPRHRPTTHQLAAALRPRATGTDWLPPPVARSITVPGATPSTTRIPPHPSRRKVLRVSGLGVAALAGMGTVRALTGAGPSTATVRWVTRATAVTKYDLGPVTREGLFFFDRTVVTHSSNAQVDLCCLDPVTGRRRWRRSLPPFGRLDGGAAAAPRSVVVRTPRDVLVIASDTGQMRWSRQRTFPGYAPEAVYGAGIVYDIGTSAQAPDAGTVHAHALDTGAVVWERQIDGRPTGTLKFSDGVLYVASASTREGWERVYALEAVTGAMRWVSPRLDDPAGKKRLLAPYRIDATLSVSGGVVYLSVQGRLLHALDARTGAVRWSIRPPVEGTPAIGQSLPSGAYPVSAGDTVLLATGDGALRAFDARDGHQLWAADTFDQPVSVSVGRRRYLPLIHRDLLFVRSTHGVRAMRIHDGSVRWERETDPSAGAAVLAGGSLHIPAGREVTSHDPVSGRVLQRLDLQALERTPTAILSGENALYVLAGLDVLLAATLPR